jgi:hypothetical protein
MKTKEKAIHLTVSLVLNEDSSWSYHSPKVETRFEMHLPVRMFNGRGTGESLSGVIGDMIEDFPNAVAEYEAEEAARKAEEEAQKLVEEEKEKTDF